MATMNITIVGFIRDQKTKRGIGNLRVEVWDRDMLIKASIGTAVTDLSGRFEILLTNEYVTKMFKGRKVILYFKVFLKEKLIESTEKTVLWNIEEGIKVVDIVIKFPEKQPEEIPTNDSKSHDGKSIFNANPNLLRKKFENINFQDQNQKEYFNELFNKALKEKLIDIAGKNRATLQKIIEAIKLNYEDVLELDLNTLFLKFIVPEITKFKIQDAEVADIKKAFEQNSRIKVRDILQFDSPIKDNHIIGKEVRKIQTREFGNIVGLKGDKLKIFTENDLDWENINEACLYPLIKDGTITEAEKDDLLVIANLSRLTGDNLPFIQLLKTPHLRTLEEYVLREDKDWIKVIQENKIALPDGEDSIESYAENIRYNIEKTFPNQYFFRRIVKDNYLNELKLLDTVDSLQLNNEKIIHGTRIIPEKLDWKGIKETSRKPMESNLLLLTEFSNTYRHLGIPKYINDTKLDTTQKKDAISKRLKALKTFIDNNKILDLYNFDLLRNDNGLNWSDIDPNDQKPVKSQLLAYQRVLTLMDDFKTREILLRNGLDSALSVASLKEEDFRQKSGLDYSTSQLVYQKARGNALMAINYYQNIHNSIKDIFNHTAVSNLQSIYNDIKDIDGYEDLFGSLDYCDCEHCKSIIGPAAYFTDLMYFIQENISKKLLELARPNDPIYLKNRRPDLWDLPLTCFNTTTEIPYLEIVNEVLESYIEHTWRNGQNKPDVYNIISQANISSTLPVNLPLEELRLYISHFNLTLYDVYKILKQSRKILLSEKLNISEEELNVIVNANPDQALQRFGNVELTDLKVETFLEYARIKRDELDDLLKTTFDNEISNVKIDKEDPIDIQKYDEILKELTKERLDHIHRYLRLWKKTKWTIPEFDLLLNSLKAADLVDDLRDIDKSEYAKGEPKILLLADLAVFQDELCLSAEELALLIPWRSAESAETVLFTSVMEGQKSLFERVFNLEKIFGNVKHVEITSKQEEDNITLLLLSGLGISESDLKALFKYLNAPSDGVQEIELDYIFLSNLFRHCRIARGLNLSIEDLIGAMQILFQDGFIDHTDRLHQLIEFNKWLKKSPFSVSDLLFILKGIETSQKQFQSNTESTAAAILEIQKTQDLDKKELFLSYLEKYFNLTSDQLRKEYLPKLIQVNISDEEVSRFLHSQNSEVSKEELERFTQICTDLIRHLERVQFLFDKLEFSSEAISFFVEYQDIFGVKQLNNLELHEIQLADSYRTLVSGMNKEEEAKIQQCLQLYPKKDSNESSETNYGIISKESLAIITIEWKQPAGLLNSLSSSFSFSEIPLEGIIFLLELKELAVKLGIQGYSLKKLKAIDYDGLVVARDIAIGALFAKYNEDDVRREKMETCTDKINTIKRDALCDYIIAFKDRFKFKDRSDLHYYFLLDVEMSGSFMTTKLESAISSLQLYVHRCLMNLEQSKEDTDVKVKAGWIIAEEWDWMKNYRLWEANRKIFLFPENYADPSLRLNKTHLFKELEEELLHEKISMESADAAYKKYLAGFSELAKLRYAGAYYHSVPSDLIPIHIGNSTSDGVFYVSEYIFPWENEKCEYYLFARTSTDPYQYYYRTYNHYIGSWGHWIKIDLTIEADELSALIFRGKLYIFWTEVQSKELTNVTDETSSSDGYVFKVFTKYACLNENGKWTTPHRVFVGNLFSTKEDMFRSVLNSQNLNVQEQEKIIDFVLNRFSKHVSSKPYARLNEDPTHPIILAYIWSRQVEKNIYIINELEKDTPIGLIIIKPEVFTVYNSQFSNCVNNSSALLITAGEKHELLPWPVVMTLINSTTCNISLDNGYNYDVTISLKEEFPEIMASEFSLSLSTNTIGGISAGEDLEATHSLEDENYCFLQNEYQKLLEEDTFSHHVENGYKTFTSSERKIDQTKAGDATLITMDSLSDILIANRTIVKLTTSSTDELMDILFSKGLEQFLSIHTQLKYNTAGEKIDLAGPYGEYYWEMFFHIPFLIANHLNANQKFNEAKWWYERIFNPTAEEPINEGRQLDYVWQFSEFRNLDIEKLKEILTNGTAIEIYKGDPFNPHSIARLRTNAYQKAIMMKYIDNLIDWGDYLFMQDNRESINEAMMLYQLAMDILGKKPVKLGKCKTVSEHMLTYENLEERILDNIQGGSEFLITLENSYWALRQDYKNNISPVLASKHLDTVLQNSNRKDPPDRISQVAEKASRKRVGDYYKDYSDQVPGIKTWPDSASAISVNISKR